MLLTDNTYLIVIDMQKYYLLPESPYCRYFNSINPGCLDYISERCRSEVILNIRKLIDSFHQSGRKVIFLKLCSEKADRSDLHRFFRESNSRAEKAGFMDVYPLSSDPMADIVDELHPEVNDLVFIKKTFSGFNSGSLKNFLAENNADLLVVTGLATSQCVETTARDASDAGIDIIHIADAQADYEEISHNASLFSSRGVCGNEIYDTESFLREYYGKT
jgi:nicotinamidase-related amidase